MMDAGKHCAQFPKLFDDHARTDKTSAALSSKTHVDDILKSVDPIMGAGTGGAGWASAHPGKNQGGHSPPWKF